MTQDSALLRERDVIQDLYTGLTHILAYKKRGLTCTFPHRCPHSVASTKQVLLLKKVHHELKDIPAVGGKQDFLRLANWQPYSVGGGGFIAAPAGPRSTSRSVRGRSGGRRGRSSTGGSGKPPIPFVVTYRRRSTGKQTIPTGSALFPNVLKRHQKSHIIQNCPN